MADPLSTDPLDRFEAAVRVRVGGEADEWLAQVPELISAVTDAWDLHVTAVANRIDGYGMSIPARRDSDRVSLRIAYPDVFLADETMALREWDGNDARTQRDDGAAESGADAQRPVDRAAGGGADARRGGARVGRDDARAVRVGAPAVRRTADARRGSDVPVVRTEPDGSRAAPWRRAARDVPVGRRAGRGDRSEAAGRRAGVRRR